MPKFTVVIPCWNAAATLANTLHSVHKQSFEDFEVIIVDDGSTDDSAAIAANYIALDPRFTYLLQINAGPSAARNKAALHYARGEFIAFLDADDIWAEDKLELCARVLAGDNAPDAVYGRIGFFSDQPDNIETESTVLRTALTPLDLLRENTVCTTSNIVVSREWFKSTGGFSCDIVHGEDVDWLIRLAAAGARIEAIDELLVYYRTSAAGLSANIEAMRRSWRSNVERAGALGFMPDAAELASAEAIHLRYLARRALRVQSPRGAALSIALEAIALSPLGFFGSPRRGMMTLGAALCDAIAPRITALLLPR
ncbi:glycosyltransferase family 2 protein [Agrobacterium salinitolerans]